MQRDREARRYVHGLAGTFLLFVMLRIALGLSHGSPDTPGFFYVFPQIMCVLITSCWMLTIQSRIIHRSVRRLILWIGVLFLMYFFMQMIKYCLFAGEPDVTRYMWYGYYVPMTLIPLLVFHVINRLSGPQQDELHRSEILLAIPAALLCIGFLTNDLHQLAFRIPNWYETGDKGRTFGPVYYAYIVFMAVLLVLGIQSLIRLYQNRKGKKNLTYLIGPLVLGVIYMAVYTIKKEWVTIGSRSILELSEIFAFMFISFLEICIQIGLIPSNMGYGKLFSMTDISARVTDSGGETVYETPGAQKDFRETEDHHIVCKRVTGGSFYYGVDLSNLNSLNRKLDEAIVALEARNELLRHENEIVEERKRPEEAIRIYDSISENVRPQVLEIRELLQTDCADEERLHSNLVRSAVLNAYIKRRSNMELEAQKNGMLPFRELVTAAAESLEYFKLSGTETFLSFSGERSCLSGEIIQAYCAFEYVVEAILGSVDFLTVRLTLEDTICIRFQLSGQNGMPDLSTLCLDGCHINYQPEGNEATLLIRLVKGGDER